MAEQRFLRLFPVPCSRLVTLVVPALALTLTAGCSTSAEFKDRDGEGFYPTGRVTYDLNRTSAEEEDPIHPGRPSNWTLELEGTGGDGPVGAADYEISELTAGGRLRWITTENSHYDFLIGAAVTDITLDANGAINAVELDQNNVGPYLGFEARHMTSDNLSVYGRVQQSWLLSDATSLRAEIGTNIHLGGPVDLLVGYRWWRYIFAEDDIFSSTSDAELLLRGVVAGFQINL
ncbi:MAG: hypothetical protein ACI82F_004170 [Planctomycetota bacterium]|jgi:hypothetical protein